MSLEAESSTGQSQADHWTGLLKETDISWSGTVTLLFLWGIGPLIYFGIYLVQVLQHRRSPNNDDNYNEEEHNTGGVVVVKNTKEEEEEEKEATTNNTQEWTSTQYLFALVGYAIGIGNVWRFCYIIAQDGGSASLFAYIISTIFVATPLFMYEMLLGQFLRLQAANAWIYIKPRWQGLAIAQFVMLLIVQSYFVMIIGYTVPYMIASCADPLPWTLHPQGSYGYWYENILGLQEPAPTASTDDALAATDDVGNATPTTEGLVEVTDLEFRGSLVGALLFVWIVIFFSVSFGKSVLADITYVTVCAPVFLMIILIIRTAFLPGAGDGIAFYIGKFEASKIAKPKIWANALSQCLFSLSPGFGTAITLSSTTTTHEDIYKAAILTSIANTVFAVASGFAIFAMVGNIAFTTGDSVADVASTGGQGLAFITIASAMPTFGSAANALSAMFFFMLFTLGLDTSFCWAETLTASVEGFLPVDKRPKTWVISLLTCTTCFFIGLPFATTKGNVILDCVDYFVGNLFLLLVCFLESIVLNFDVGWKLIEYALQKATSGKRSLRQKYKCCRLDFHILVPVSTIVMFLFEMANTIKTPYLPDNLHIVTVGWVLFALCFVLLFIGVQDFNKEGSLAPIPDDFPYDGTEEDRLEYFTAERNQMGDTGDPSSYDFKNSNRDVRVGDSNHDNDSIELEA